MSERLTPAEYRQAEDITPETESAREHDLLASESEEIGDIELQAEEQLPETPNPRLLRQVIDREGIDLDSDVPEKFADREKTLKQLYRELGDLRRGQLAARFAEAGKLTEAVWDELHDDYKAFEASHLSEPAMMASMAKAIRALRKIRHHLLYPQG